MTLEGAVTKKKSRNSSIELLRLISMLMIVAHHYVRGGVIGESGIWIAEQQISIKKFIYQFIYMSGGWIGDCAFFTISVWFLVDKQQTLKGCLKRVWLMERQLLFWSLTLLGISYALQHVGVFDVSLLSLTAFSCFPLCLNLWWYATSYALFLLFLPFLLMGMKALGRSWHKALALIVLILWGILGMIPHVEFNLYTGSVFVFVYWFILITYYKWYMRKVTIKQAWLMIAAGVFMNIVYWIVSNLFYIHTGRFVSLQNFTSDHWFISSMLIGFGMFSLAIEKVWHSLFVNTLAGSAFGVYLIHTYGTVPLIWDRIASIRIAYNSNDPVLFGACAIVCIFLTCLSLDLVRQFLFKITVDRHKGRLFDRCWSWAERCLSRSGKHADMNEGKEMLA